MNEIRLSRQEDIPQLRKLWHQVFGDDQAYLDLFFQTAYAPERCMVLTQQGQLTGGAYWLDCSLDGRPIAYLYALAIAPDVQGQGLGTMLLGKIHSHLTALAYQAVLLVPGQESLRNYYNRFGYRTVSYYQEFSAQKSTPIPMQRLNAQTYGALRREYLGANSVLQEGASLALLDGSAQLYRGEGFLAAVDPEASHCLELLGDRSAAPGIAATLGLESCRFRVPGPQTPYAMGKNLSGPPLPQEVYFGFSF